MVQISHSLIINTFKALIKCKNQNISVNNALVCLCLYFPPLNQNYRILTINVPVVFMARYVMVLRGATSLRGALEGVGPEN